MKTARRLTTCAVLLAASAFAPLAWGQAKPASLAPAVEPVLKAIPDNALGFLVVKNLDKTDKAISKLGAAVEAPVPSVLELFKQRTGIQEGLDVNGSAAVAVLPDESAEAGKMGFVPVIFLPVTDYKKFISQFHPDDATAKTITITIAGEQMVVGQKDSFAVLAPNDKQDQLTKALASTAGVDAVVESFNPWIRRHQISLVTTPTGSKLVVQAALGGLKKFRRLLEAAPSAPNNVQVDVAMNMYDKLLGKATNEVESLGIGIHLDEHSNLSIDSRTTFVAGASWAAALKGLKSSKEKQFVGLPVAPFVFAGEGIIPKKWIKGFAAMGFGYMNQMNQAAGGEKLDKEQQKKFTTANEAMLKGLDAISFLMETPKQGESMYDGMVGVMKVDDTKSFLERYQKSLETMSEITEKQKHPLFRLSDVKKIEIDGASGIVLTMDMSGIVAAQKNPASEKMMPLLFGSDSKITTRMLAADDHTFVVAYGSEEHAKEALANFKNQKSDFASDPNVAATLKLLPPHPQWIGLVSIQGYVDFLSGITAAIGVPFKLPELPAMPPVGFAAEGGPHGLTTQLVLPVETLAGISNVVHGLIGAHARPEN